MSRVSKRAGTKALVCHECVKATKNRPNSTPRNVGSFRGKSLKRLEDHIEKVHKNPRTIAPRTDDMVN